MVVTADEKLLALDAKFNFDDNALYRHKDIQELQDKEQEEPLEIQARDWGINNYVKTVSYTHLTLPTTPYV